MRPRLAPFAAPPLTLAAAALGSTFGTLAHAQPPDAAAPDRAPSHGDHHLFNPTPRDQMREFETDRPDTTESPYSVDAGHFQLEMDAVSGERDAGQTELALGTTNLKLGLTSAMDLQLIVEPYVQRGNDAGLGDLTLRLKHNLWGNDGGGSALAVMPFVRLPSAAEPLGTGHTEAGLIVPIAGDGPAGFELGGMIEADLAYHEDHYSGDLIASVTAGHSLVGELEGYLELISETPLDVPSDSALTSSLGLALGLNDDLRVDSGARVGLNAAAPDLALFVGGSARY